MKKKKFISIALSVCLLFSIATTANAATNTTKASTPNASGTGSITVSSTTSRSATGKTSANPGSSGTINGVSVTAILEYGVGDEKKSVSATVSSNGDLETVTATAPYTYVNAIKGIGKHYYSAYNWKTGEGESVLWSSEVSP